MIKISAILFCLLTTNMAWGQKSDFNIVVNTDFGEMQSLSLANNENNISNGDLLKGYIQQRFDDMLPMGKKASRRSARVGLSGIDQKAYDYLKSQIQQVASGAISSTEFSIPLTELTSDVGPWTAEELGVTYIYDSTKEQPWNSEAQNAARNKVSFDLHKVIDALLADCPYELYWYDKVKGCTYSPYDSYSYSGATNQLSIQGNTTLTMKVAQEYAVQGDGVYYPTQFNTEKVDAVNVAIANAQGIVNRSTGSTLQKLITYKEQICELTSYNSLAADNSSYPYGDPWQLVWVFDGDESTKVVCEGYSKAFKYLCDLSGFQNVECLIVTGTMNGGTGAGNHMWNVMKMDDGRNYLIDVTNCDTGTIGAPNHLFMAYGPSGSYDQDYTFSVGNYNIMYTYDSDTKSAFGEHALTISELEYTPIGDVNSDGNVSVEEISLKAGETKDLKISLSSAVTEKVGVQFDVTLPEGFSLETIDDKVYKLSSNQTSDMTCNVSDLGNNAFRFILYSGTLQKLTAGELMSLNLKVNSTKDMGSYSVSISNVVFSDIDGIVTKETGVNATVNVYLLGDANGDGSVDIADAVCIVNHVVGKPNTTFIKAAADANNDGDIDIADAVHIVNYVVGKIPALAPRFEWNLPEPE